MANFSKAFNFRGGFQVDNDVLVVRGQNVGIGSTIPNERLAVDGTIKAEGLEISSFEPVAIQSATVGFLSAGIINSGVTSISNGIITATSLAGVVTYYGDGGRLLNLPTSQWLDVDVGLGFTSIYAQGYVGVDTTDPRYVFQVGGVPFAPKAGFLTSQTGVGIEDGNIFASGDINAGGDFNLTGEVDIIGSVSVGQTVTAGQFVGFGSGIQNLNASNLGVGSIPPDVYGDTIITGTVFGDRFAGVADTALSVAIDADLVFDTATGREIQATQRFFSPTGKIQVGTDLFPSVGDIDVKKDIGDSTIYSLSTSATSRVFVGKDRDTGSNTSFGGLRFGGNILTDPLSTVADLDVVNYDVGNLNFYLHSGPNAPTTGAFRWLYGQTDRTLADLSPLGKLSLKGNQILNELTLEVLGDGLLSGKTIVGGGISVTGNSSINGDLLVEGDLTLTGSIGVTTDNLTLPRTTFIGDVLVTDGGASAVAITTSGDLSVNGDLILANGTQPVVTMSGSGNIDGVVSLAATNVTVSSLLDADTLNAEVIIGQNGFLNNITGAQINNLNVTNQLVADSAQINNLNILDLSVPTIIVDEIVAGQAGITTVNANRVNTAVLGISSTVTLTLTVGAGLTSLVIFAAEGGATRTLTLPFD